MNEHKQLMIPEKQYNFLATLIESKKLPVHVKTVEDAFTIAQMGRELGFATMQAFHYIIPIQGKLSLAAKAIGALLRKGGVKYTTTEDGVFVYRDESTSEFRREKEKPIDRRTTIVFERGDQVEKTTFTWLDAIAQELTSKSNWIKMPKEMLWARCLSKGANRIGSDLLLGLYSTEEMFDVFGCNTKVKRDEDGHIVEVVDTEAEILSN
ncbi:MAG TPA: hypothetical protein VGM30_10380 [Puia sp.]|jgi:hypothetical protein